MPPPPPPGFLTDLRATAGVGINAGGAGNRSNGFGTAGGLGGAGVLNHQTPSVASVPWYQHTVFIQVMLVIGVFFFTWLVLAAIRPPFTRKPKPDVDVPGVDTGPNSFSPGKGAAFAAGAAVLCAVGMLVLAFVPGVIPKKSG